VLLARGWRARWRARVAAALATLGALAVNLWCALQWARVRQQGGTLVHVAYLSARNDAAANVAILGAAAATLVWA
jgi:Co/Zn/Cd efflux system component